MSPSDNTWRYVGGSREPRKDFEVRVRAHVSPSDNTWRYFSFSSRKLRGVTIQFASIEAGVVGSGFRGCFVPNK